MSTATAAPLRHHDFETRAYPVIAAAARVAFKRDEQLAQDAVGLCLVPLPAKPPLQGHRRQAARVEVGPIGLEPAPSAR